MTTTNGSRIGTGRWLALAAAFLIALALIGGWADLPGAAPAVGAPPGASTDGAEKALRFSSALDRKDVVEAINQTNSKLDRIIQLLESGNLQVKVVQPQAEAPGDAGKQAK